MLCPSCGYDNIEGADRCDECLTPLHNLDVPRAEIAEGLARSVMEDDLRELDQEFLGVTSNTPALEVIDQMRRARVGCALVIDGGKLLGIFTERDVLNKLTGKFVQHITFSEDSQQLSAVNHQRAADTRSPHLIDDFKRWSV